jgi:RNA polymerase sigma-70 factor (ECF subfamily)
LRVRDPDVDLVRRTAAGDNRAAAALVARHLSRIAGLARRMLNDASEAEDVAQETFLRAWKAAASWREGEALFSTWLHRVATNLCLDRLRRRRELPTEDAGAALIDETPQGEARLAAAEKGAAVRAALDRLPERQRAAIVLCHFQELGNIEAAAALEISVEALESLLSRGRRALRASLADLGGEP